LHSSGRERGKNGSAPRPQGRGAECSVVQCSVAKCSVFCRAAAGPRFDRGWVAAMPPLRSADTRPAAPPCFSFRLQVSALGLFLPPDPLDTENW